MNVAPDLFYTKEHEWAKISGGMATVGITDHAQHSLGDITFAEVMKIGTKVKQSDQFATVESVKAASDVYAPFSGEIVKINAEIASAPELINKSPYDKGWFAVIKIDDEKEKSKLMNAADYKKYLEGLE